jgi:asparagine N-glycosylation enzyme membrane subunit Stt3
VASAKLPIHTKEHGFVYDASIQPAIKIFEVVDGATLTGRTEPGTEVVASAEIHTPSGRRFPYQVKAEAGSDGRFELVVPYPSGVAAGARALAPYRLQLAGKPGEIPVAVSAEQVRKGARIDAMAAGRRPEPTATIPGVTTSPK